MLAQFKGAIGPVRSFCSSPARVALAAVVTVTAAASAQAPSMPPIDFPLDTASVVTATVAAGVVLLTLVYPVKIGFSFLHRLVGRLTGSM